MVFSSKEGGMIKRVEKVAVVGGLLWLIDLKRVCMFDLLFCSPGHTLFIGVSPKG
jgi:hypothetical protein